MKRAAIFALPALLFAAAPVVAQDAPAYGYAQPIPQSGYDTDGQSVDSIAVFFEPLSHYGRWLDTRYGRAWAPNVARDWRPYTIGHWEEGRYGLTWRSDEPFGWAVFHFGRWAFDDHVGWVWLPDVVWGPGWVAWRDSDDVTGWAPLPPQIGVFALGTGYGFNDWGYDQWYQPGWVYVPRGFLYNRSLRGVYLPYARNREIWERTRGVTRYDRVDGQVVNRSFGEGRRGDAQRDSARDNARDNTRDNSRDMRRDTGGRPDLRSTQPYGDGARPVPQAQYGGPGRDAGAPSIARGFDRRDGFVPGTPQARGVDRRAVPPAGLATRPAPPFATSPTGRPTMAPPMVRPPMPAPMAMPRPAPAPAAHPRESNANERPR